MQLLHAPVQYDGEGVTTISTSPNKHAIVTERMLRILSNLLDAHSQASVYHMLVSLVEYCACHACDVLLREGLGLRLPSGLYVALLPLLFIRRI